MRGSALLILAGLTFSVSRFLGLFSPSHPPHPQAASPFRAAGGSSRVNFQWSPGWKLPLYFLFECLDDRRLRPGEVLFLERVANDIE